MYISMAIGGSIGHGHQHKPYCIKTMYLDMALYSNTEWDITMAFSGSRGHSGYYGPQK